MPIRGASTVWTGRPVRAEETGCGVVGVELEMRPLFGGVRVARTAFEQQYVETLSGEFGGDHRATPTSADHNDVTHSELLESLVIADEIVVAVYEPVGPVSGDGPTDRTP